MRIIDYYNYIATAACIFIGVAALVFCARNSQENKSKKIESQVNKSQINKSQISEKRWPGMLANILLVAIMLIAAFLRLYKLGAIPYGLQQDEASIGYDAYTLANFGIDRNGYHYPVYPITWGCGGGSPLLIYLNVISISLFGTGIVKLRLIPAVFGILTVFLFYLTLKIIFEKKPHNNAIALFGAFFLAICPWHVILSRWSLDSNIMPFNIMLAIYLFLLGAKKNSTFVYCLSSAAFAICMYSYGAATVVVPIFLVLICIYAVRKKILSLRQLILSVITFMIVFLPLFIFYGVNYLGFSEIVTDHISFNRFTADRTGEAFSSHSGGFFKGMLSNLWSMLLAMSVGDTSHTLAHYYPGYASLYEFTYPITLLGFAYLVVQGVKSLIGIKSKKTEDDKTEHEKTEGEIADNEKDDEIAGTLGVRNSGNDSMYNLGSALFIALLIGCVVLQLFVIPDISRMVMTFIPFIFFMVKGFEFVLDNSARLSGAFCALILIGALSFSKDYFTDYNNWAISIFMPGYGDAIERAYEIAGDDRQIYSTYEGLSAPFMLALYYNEYDPYKFYTTVEYKDEKAEFRIAKSFGNFKFELPPDPASEIKSGAVFVVASSECDIFSEIPDLNYDDFGGYYVVYQ